MFFNNRTYDPMNYKDISVCVCVCARVQLSQPVTSATVGKRTSWLLTITIVINRTGMLVMRVQIWPPGSVAMPGGE